VSGGLDTAVPLGSQGLAVSPLGLGCMSMSEHYGPPDEAEARATLLEAVELGITLFDTADSYGPHTNEALVGSTLAPFRDQVAIATKFGFTRSPENPTDRNVDGRPEYVRAACEASLRRLGTDRIDLYFQHRVDPDVPVEETVGAMGELVAAGKVRAIGLCEVSAATLRRAHAVHPVSAVQSEFSLWSRDPLEDGVLETARELGIGFVAYSPLGRGFLTGAIRGPEDLDEADYRRTTPRLSAENLGDNLGLLDVLEGLARARGCTPAQLALAWVAAQPAVVPIAGTRRRAHLGENVAALALELTPADREAIAAAVPRPSGERYSAAGMGLVEG
jgi:aryl-alcohol dehydrogenase-like predicted oxidoreductase